MNNHVLTPKKYLRAIDQLSRLVEAVRSLHCRMRDRVVASCEGYNLEAGPDPEQGSGDFIYPIDRVSEQELLTILEAEFAEFGPMILIGEGIPDGQIVFPAGATEKEALWRVIVDPIDGTRGLMYQKRSAWILTGIAPNRGAQTGLHDIEAAVQTEIPLLKQHLCDQLWALRGRGIHALRKNRFTGDSKEVLPRPSSANTLRHGYATVCRFFPGGRDILATIDDRLMAQLLGSREPDEATVFEDQYACTGGQLYGLTMGQDRFIADLRPLLAEILAERSEPLGHCCHPYDLCTALIAEEAGVVVRDVSDRTIDAPLDTSTNVAWAGYANQELFMQIEPMLKKICQELGLLGD